MFNLQTKTIQESVNVVFDDAGSLADKSIEEDHSDLVDEDYRAPDPDVVTKVDPTSGTISSQNLSDLEDEVEVPDYLFSSERRDPLFGRALTSLNPILDLP